MTIPPCACLWLTTWLGALSVCDITSGRLPNSLTYSGIVLAFLPQLTPLSNSHAMLGLLLGFAYPWCCRNLYFQLKGQHGLGLGDCKMLAMIGAWIGPSSVPTIILLASLLGIVFIGYRYYHCHRDWKNPMAFGPAIALATLLQTYLF